MIFRYSSSQMFVPFPSGVSLNGMQLISPSGLWEDVAGEIFVLLAQRPHLQKHCRKALRGASLHHDAAVLPVPVGMGDVQVFVRKVQPAREGGLAVDDRDFTVRAVVLTDVDGRGGTC